MKTDINQEGLENSISFKSDNQMFSLFNNFSKSRKDTGQAQNRRPDLSYGANYFKKIRKSPIGEVIMNVNYKHTGKYTDWDGSKNSVQESVDLVDLSIKKKLSDNLISLNIKNLFNKNYEKPATYSQDKRKISINFQRSY